MKGWRKSTHGGQEYFWRVTTDRIVVRIEKGPQVVNECLYKFLNMAPDDLERSRWKGNPHKAVKPSDIVTMLDKELDHA